MLSDFGLQDQLFNNPAVYSNEPGAKDVTTAKTCGRKYIRNSGYGGSTRTAFQSSVKAVFKQRSAAAAHVQAAASLPDARTRRTKAGDREI